MSVLILRCFCGDAVAARLLEAVESMDVDEASRPRHALQSSCVPYVPVHREVERCLNGGVPVNKSIDAKAAGVGSVVS